MLKKIINFFIKSEPTTFAELMGDSRQIEYFGQYQSYSYECPVDGCRIRRQGKNMKMHIAKSQNNAHREFYNKYTKMENSKRRVWLLK